MLTQDQMSWITIRVNEKVNLPVLGEEAESLIFTAAVEKIDKILDKELPAKFKEFLNNASMGITPGSPADLKVMKEGLVNFICGQVKIPVIGEKAEKKLISEVVEIIVEALQKGKKIAA
jgi:hypothetical protein